MLLFRLTYKGSRYGLTDMGTLHLKKRSVSLPGFQSPAAGFEAPFEMLGACHEQVERMLALMEKLQAHLRTQTCDEPSRQAARDVIRYFDVAAPLHHEDEERHVFPPLLEGADASVRNLVQRLLQEHRQMAALWVQVRAVLQILDEDDAANAGPQPWREDQSALLHDFAALYRRHLQDEERLAYPAAKTALSNDALHTMGHDMMRRRGVVIPAS